MLEAKRAVGLRDADALLIIRLIATSLTMSSLAETKSALDKERMGNFSVADHQINGMISQVFTCLDAQLSEGGLRHATDIGDFSYR